MYPVTVADPKGSEEEDASPLAYSNFYPWKTPQVRYFFWKYFIALFVKLLQPIFWLKMHQKRLATGLCPARRESLQAFPDPIAGFKVAASRQERTGNGCQEKDKMGRERRDQHIQRPIPGSAADPWYIAAIVFPTDELLEIARENCFATQWHILKLRNCVFTFLCWVS